MNAQNVNEILDALAARLAVPAAHLWAVLIRQAYVEFYVSLVAFLVTGAVSGFCLWQYNKRESRWDGDGWMIVAIVFGIGWVVAFVAVLATFGGVINPEYYALHEILAAVKR